MAPAHPPRPLARAGALLLAPLLAACATRAPAPEAHSEPAPYPEDNPCIRPPCEQEDALDGPVPSEEVDAELHADDGEVELEFDHSLGEKEPIDPFGATPPEIVAQMLRLAEVGKNDIVYDLGSGDGRIPIAAARTRGARGVGVELRSELVEDSRRAARAARVGRRVRFIEGDIFEVDISEATVVMLYLYPRTTLALRPKLLTELRPGARIVAFEFGIEGWPRDREEPAEHTDFPDEDDLLYYYVVPANVSGAWQVSVSLPGGSPIEFTMHLEQTFQQVSGTAVVGEQELALEDLAIRGDTLTFSLPLPGASGDERIALSGTVSGDRVKGNVKRPAAWHAVRDPATVIPIDPSLRP
jgi:SAM-dependent methyltransferase